MEEPTFSRGPCDKKRLKNSETDSDGKTKKIKKIKKDDQSEVFFIKCISLPKLDTFDEGMLVLGCIQEVSDLHLIVSLPGGFLGRIDLNCISDRYTTMLKSYTKELTRDIPKLYSMYSEGDTVCCKVKSLQNDKGNYDMKLTMNPNDVLNGIHPNELSEGMVIPAIIASIEDHGFVMDIGYPMARCFIKNSSVKQYIKHKNRGRKLSEGQVLLCYVSSITSLSDEAWNISLTLDPETLVSGPPEDKTILSQNLTPGTVIRSTVKEILPDGLVLKLGGGYKGKIHCLHLNNSKSKVDEYEVGMEVFSMVLYTETLLKLVTLSLSERLICTRYRKPFEKLQKCSGIQKASVVAVRPAGVTFNIKKGTRAFCPIEQLSSIYEEEADLLLKYTANSIHNCRITTLNVFDEVAIVSLRKEDLDKNIIFFQDIAVGDVTETVIKKIKKGVIYTQIGEKIQAVCVNLHTANFPLQNPELKYKEGSKIECRVLKKVSSEKLVFVTLKKALINSKFPVFADYDSLVPGSVVEGWVVQSKDSLARVEFYNGISGLLSLKKSETVHLGQVVVCHVDSNDEDGLLLSLNNEVVE